MDDLANGLLALGVRKGDAFAILGATSLEWCLFDFALGLVGAIGAPVYANSSPQDCAYVLDHSEAVGVLVEDDEQLAKVEEVRGELPRLRHVLTVRRPPRASRRAAASTPPSIPTALADATAQVGEDDLFTYIYTSGTTGPPKACMIRHRNYYEMAAVVDKMPTTFVGPDDTLLLYLPLAHNFGRLMHLQAALRRLHARLLPRPAPRRRRARRASGRPSSRACRASTRRSTRRVAREVRRGDAAPKRAIGALGARRRSRGQRRCGRRASPSRGGSRSGTASPTGSSTRR